MAQALAPVVCSTNFIKYTEIWDDPTNKTLIQQQGSLLRALHPLAGEPRLLKGEDVTNPCNSGI